MIVGTKPSKRCWTELLLCLHYLADMSQLSFDPTAVARTINALRCCGSSETAAK